MSKNTRSPRTKAQSISAPHGPTSLARKKGESKTRFGFLTSAPVPASHPGWKDICRAPASPPSCSIRHFSGTATAAARTVVATVAAAAFGIFSSAPHADIFTARSMGHQSPPLLDPNDFTAVRFLPAAVAMSSGPLDWFTPVTPTSSSVSVASCPSRSGRGVPSLL